MSGPPPALIGWAAEMCRPDDFPPYEASGIFRGLGPAEVADFRAWAREHHAPGDPVNALWHPVIRDECRIIDDEPICPHGASGDCPGH